MVSGDGNRRFAERSLDVQLRCAVDRIADEMRSTFSRETVETIMRVYSEAYRESRVQDFVSLLVERRTREHLRALAAGRALGEQPVGDPARLGA